MPLKSLRDVFLPVSSSRLRSGALSLISIARYFYSKQVAKVTLLVVLVAAAVPAQKKKVEGPRALALAVMSPDGKTPARLIPICIRDNGQFWDATVYQASPRPMALEPGVVYELERTGEPIGYFTVGQAVQENGSWFGTGRWDVRRAGTAGSSAADAGDDERPVLRRSKPPETGAPSQPPSAASQPTPPQEDRDRPVLHRGQPSPQPPASASPKPTGPDAAPQPKAAPEKSLQLVPAISDAGGPEPRAFTMELNADQQARLRIAVSGLVPLKLAGASFNTHFDYKESQIRFFDLDTNNSAVVVLTGRLSKTEVAPTGRRQPKGTARALTREFYVTIIAREDLNLKLHEVYSRIVEARNLDLDGRLELIDAVDADGDGRGELLFRRTTGKNVSYVVLKVGLSRYSKLFDSAGE